MTQHHILTTVTVNGTPLGVFESRSGGESSAEVAKYRPGGMQKEKARKGQSVTGDVTVSRTWERERDLELERWLRPLAGRADMVVSDQPLDDDGVPFGRPTTWTGTLQSVSGGDADANSNDSRPLQLVMVTTEVA